MTMFRNASTFKDDDFRLLADILVSALSSPAPVARTLTSTVHTEPFSTAPGDNKITFTTSEDFTGTINGVARYGNFSYTFDAGLNNTLPGISCEVSAGSVTVDRLI